MAGPIYSPLFLRGIELFNRREFFECHETWEELWISESGPSRQFYKGLIQAAVALHHLRRGNVRGARKLLTSSRAYLDPYRPKHLGIDVDRLLADMAGCFDVALPQMDGQTRPLIEEGLFPDLWHEQSTLSENG